MARSCRRSRIASGGGLGRRVPGAEKLCVSGPLCSGSAQALRCPGHWAAGKRRSLNLEHVEKEPFDCQLEYQLI
ncbi:MAG: hypothetical protein ACLU9S_11215 [Oscillospiraceae bacterium]